MRRALLVIPLLFAIACARSADPAPDPWSPGPLTLLDPDAREAVAARLETAQWPADKARAVSLLEDWVRRWGVRTPLPFFQRLAGELPEDRRRALWLQALSTYPGERPYPPREDPVASHLLRELAASPRATPESTRELVDAIHALLERLGPIADPRHQVRSTVADLMSGFSPGDRVTGLVLHLLGDGVPGAVRARAMLSLGVGGFEDPALLPALFQGLHEVRDHVNLAPFALTALSGARGAARAIAVHALEHTLGHDRFLAEGFTPPPGAGRGGDPLVGVLEAWESAPAALQDPSLMLRTFARVLTALGEEEASRRLLTSRYSLAGRPADSIPSETFHAVREILLAGLPPSRGLPEEEAIGITFGEELANRAVAVSRVGRSCAPRALEVLLATRHTATVRLTTLDWVAQFRDAALKAALARSELTQELTREWNAQETEEGQWRQTARFWMPLVRVPGEGKTGCDPDDPFDGMSPDEWLRARIERTLWVCDTDGRLPPAPPAGPATPLADWERAWSPEREQARVARVTACLASRREELVRWERQLAGCDTFDCLWDRLVTDGLQWPEAALEKALGRLTGLLDGDAAMTLARRLPKAPRELAAQALEWFEHRLPHGARIAIRDALRTETCLQDPACLPVLLQAVQLANRREVRSEPIPTRE